jgi:hypothetical protein
MSQLIAQRGYECPKCGHSDRTLYNSWADNYAEIYCDRCAQHFASEDYGEPFEATDEPRNDCRGWIVRRLLHGVTNSFSDEDELL